MRPVHLSSFALLVTLGAISCAPAGQAPPPSDPSQGGHEAPVVVVPPKPVSAPATPKESFTFAESSNALAMDLYSRFGASGGNFAFSPASIETALTMTWAGAKGDTATEMQKVLHLHGGRDDALDSAAHVVLGYQKEHTGYELSFADKLYGDASYPFDPGFVSLSQNTFGAPLEAVDFLHAPDAGRVKINDFVAASTKGKITGLLPEGAVTKNTELVLVNAVYMHAGWQFPFDPNETSPRSFSNGDAAHAVPTMHEEANLGYAETDTAQALDLPYQGGDLAMTIILPKDKSGLDGVERSLMQTGAFDRLVSATKTTDVAVSLPKFTIGQGEPQALGPALRGLGMKLAFDQLLADFTGISKGGQRLHISDVFHKAFIAVAEKGTEAAAATAVVVNSRASIEVAPQHVVSFNADHPFIYAIRDVHTNLILFVGRVSDPQV